MSTAKKIDVKYIINCLVFFFFLFGFGYLPAPDPITPMGMKVLGCFFALLYGWATLDLIWTSILGAIVFGLSGYMSFNDVLLNGFGSNMAVTVMFIGIFITYLSSTGLSKTIAMFFLTRKIAQGRPWVLTTLIFAAAYVLGTTVSVIPAIVLMWSIYDQINEALGFDKKDKYPVLVILGICYCAMLASCVFPFWPISMIMIGSLQGIAGISINYLSFSVVSFILSIFCFVVYILVMRFVFRPDIQPLIEGQSKVLENFKQEPIDIRQKIGFAALVIFLVCVFLPYLLPAGMKLKVILSSLNVVGITMVILAVLSLVRLQDGKPILDFEPIAKNGMMWSIFIMFGATMPIAAALESDATGIMAFILGKMTPIFSDMSPVVFVVAVSLFLCALTQVAHNLVLAVISVPLFYGFCVQLGASPEITLVLCSFGINMAVATPGGSAMSAMFFSHKEYVNPGTAYLYTITAWLITMLAIGLVGYPLANIFF